MKHTRLLMILGMVLASFLVTSCTGCSEDVLDTSNNIDNSTKPDLDNDGTPDYEDDDIDNDGIPNDEDDDIDGDGIPNDEDDDIDGDGIPNDEDGDIDNDGKPNNEDDDIDGDGIPNDEDDDIDNDGKPNDEDDTPDGEDTNIGTEEDNNNDNNNGDKDDDADYLVVRVDDSVFYDVELSDNGSDKITKVEELEIDEIRESLDDAGVELDHFDIVGIKLLINDKGTHFIEENKNKKFVLEIFVDGELAVSSPKDGDAFDVLEFGVFEQELSLNDGLYITNPAFKDFLTIVQDNSKKSAKIEIIITPVDEFKTKAGEKLEVIFIAQATTKKSI